MTIARKTAAAENTRTKTSKVPTYVEFHFLLAFYSVLRTCNTVRSVTERLKPTVSV